MQLHRTKLAYLFILPSFFLLTAIIFYPILRVFYLSFFETTAYGTAKNFIGLPNYLKLFNSSIFWMVLKNSVYWTVGVVGFTILVSLPLAVALNERFKGRKFARGILMLPWATSLMITGLLWRWILNSQYGMLNHLLLQLHVIEQPIYWLARSSTSFPAMIGVGVIVSIPFTTTVFLAGLQAIPGYLYEAAKVDGARGWDRFRYIALPNLKTVFTIAVLLNVIYVFNSFPIIWSITQGGPANTTDTVITYLYKVAFEYSDFGRGAALAIVMFVILLGFSLLYIRFSYKEELE